MTLGAVSIWILEYWRYASPEVKKRDGKEGRRKGKIEGSKGKRWKMKEEREVGKKEGRGAG